MIYLLLSTWVTTHALAVVNYAHGKAWFEKQQIKAGRSTAYKRDLTSEQLQDVEVPINHLLEQYGYK